MIKIFIDLDGDLTEAISQVENLIDQINEFPKVLADIGVEQAQTGFDNYQAVTKYGVADGYDRSPVNVSAIKTKEGAEIVASGEEVVFAEYGTGVFTDDQHKAYSNIATPPVEVDAGSYSRENAGVFDRHGYWHYGGTLYYGSVPTYAMTNTIEELRNGTEDIARTHFR